MKPDSLQNDGDSSTASPLEKSDASPSRYVIDFNVVMKAIGSMGKYQIFLVALAYWIPIPAGFTQVASVFLAPIPDHRCALPPLDNTNLYPGLSETELRNLTLPIDSNTGTYDQCTRYNYNLTSCTNGSLGCIDPYPPVSPVVEVMKCDKGYWYDTSIYTNVVTSEWNLVCDRLIIGTSVTAVYFFGILLSSVVGGNIADIIGRCPTMLLSQIGMIAFGVGCSFAPNLVGFAALRFCIALFLQAGYIACFVYVMEITGERWRTFIGINIQAMFAVGYMTLSGFAYVWRDWRDLQLAIAFVSLPFLVFWFFLPESPRWLFTVGKVEKAKRISEVIASRNGNVITEQVWSDAEKAGEAQQEDLLESKPSPFILLKRPRMRLVTINMMFNWFVCSLVYYGLSLNAGALAGDDFLNNTLNGLVEFVAYAIVILTMDRLGRKPLLSACLLLGGVGCLVSTVITHYAGDNRDLINTSTAFALIGKSAISGAFSIVYNYTAELYPTVVRSTAVGVGSMAARVGSIITPFTIQLQYIIPWLTGTIFGVLALVAGLSSLAFPETLGTKMMTSLDEAELFYAGKSADFENKNDSELASCSNSYSNEAFETDESSNQTKL